MLHAMHHRRLFRPVRNIEQPLHPQQVFAEFQGKILHELVEFVPVDGFVEFDQKGSYAGLVAVVSVGVREVVAVCLVPGFFR